MSPDAGVVDEGGGPRRIGFGRLLGGLALLAMVAFGTLLGVRPLSNPDLGYHLAYGEEFLDTGRPVDTNPWVYVNDPSLPPDKRPAPGPGCWYDDNGVYHFPNANWLTQVVLAVAMRLGGPDALCAMNAILTGGIFVLAALCMWRLGLPTLWWAAGLGLIAMTAYERFVLRPETFSYVILLGQLGLLLPIWGRFSGAAGGGGSRQERGESRQKKENEKGRRTKVGLSVAQNRELGLAGASDSSSLLKVSPVASSPSLASSMLSGKRIALLVLLQLLLANLHSYFLLGLALSGAVLADAVLRSIYVRLRGGSLKDHPRLRQWVIRLALLVGLQAAVCFVNPWTWRNAVLPFQTVAFLRENKIGSQNYDQTFHPWAVIGELFNPFEPTFRWAKATYASYFLIAAGGCGLIAALIRRRWAYALILLGIGSTAMSVRRNIGFGAMLLTPIILASLWELLQSRRELLRRLNGRWLKPAAAMALIAAAAAGSLLVVSQDFYYAERQNSRFGWGIAKLDVPMDVCKWLDDNRPQGRLFTDYTTSSGLYYFSKARPDIPTLTNTWAYPPDTMKEILALLQCRRDFSQAVKKYDLQTIVLRVADAPDLAAQLAALPAGKAGTYAQDWEMVYFDGVWAVFLKKSGPNGPLAARLAMQYDHVGDMAAFKRRLKDADPVPAYGLHIAGLSLQMMDWQNCAIDVFREAAACDGSYYRTWLNLGVSLGRRADRRLETRDFAAAQADLVEAIESFRKAWDRCGGDEKALANIRNNIDRAQGQLQLAQEQSTNVKPIDVHGRGT